MDKVAQCIPGFGMGGLLSVREFGMSDILPVGGMWTMRSLQTVILCILYAVFVMNSYKNTNKI